MTRTTTTTDPVEAHAESEMRAFTMWTESIARTAGRAAEAIEKIRAEAAANLVDRGFDEARLMGAAQAEAVQTVWLDIQASILAGIDPVEAFAEAKNSIERSILHGSDDTWSGRGNDMRRAKLDGRRDFLRSFEALGFDHFRKEGMI